MSRPDPPPAEELRRTFAQAWSEIGAAWGIAPSTALVQGYLLVHAKPLTEPEVRKALGLSHRAASLALSQCLEWGLIERAADTRRSGQRGPAAAAYGRVGDHWEWFRRVATARKERETDPVMPVLDRCVALATEAASHGGDAETALLRDQLSELRDFVQLFDLGVATFVRGDPNAIAKLFDTLSRLEPATVEQLWALVRELDPEEMTAALTALGKLPAASTRRLIALADQPVLRKLLGVA